MIFDVKHLFKLNFLYVYFFWWDVLNFCLFFDRVVFFYCWVLRILYKFFDTSTLSDKCLEISFFQSGLFSIDATILGLTTWYTSTTTLTFFPVSIFDYLLVESIYAELVTIEDNCNLFFSSTLTQQFFMEHGIVKMNNICQFF